MTARHLLVKFRVRVNRRQFYWVLVFRDREHVFAAHDLFMKEWRLPLCRHNYEAITTSYSKIVAGRRTGELGIVLFHLGSMGAGIVSHEMTHAALMWRRRRCKRATDERVCWVQGNLVMQFWRQFWKRKLDKEARRDRNRQ